ncbi:MAG: hypothetical protein JWO71_3904 [Candidatus Acidoferrum typicum]|nr:hypothetical protein [Candidatus Acidoferrum typicum]
MNTYEKRGEGGPPSSFALPIPLFTGKYVASPEKRMIPSWQTRTLHPGGEPLTAREFSMTRNQTSKRNLSGVMGIALLAIGSAVLVTYSAGLAWQFHAALNSTAVESLGFLGSIGLASLHAFRMVALDHAVLLSVVRRILVLCSALIVTLIGIALLPKRATAAATASGRRSLSAPPKGDQ